MPGGDSQADGVLPAAARAESPAPAPERPAPPAGDSAPAAGESAPPGERPLPAAAVGPEALAPSALDPARTPTAPPRPPVAAVAPVRSPAAHLATTATSRQATQVSYPDGQLKIIDRTKDIGRLRNGQMFAPKYIENKLKFFSEIREAVIFGDCRDFVAAMINIELASVAKWAERNAIAYASYQELAANTQVYAMIEKRVDAVNRALSLEPVMAGARIRRFLILPKELDPDDGELTRTQKVRRRIYRRALCFADRGSLQQRGRGVDFGRDHVRRRPQRHARGDGAHRGLAALSAGDNGRRSVTAETDDILLAVEHVSLTFGGVKAISDVSFDIRKGEIRAIIGPNGAGKTSMLNVVNGFYHPQKGAIRWRGRGARG